MSDPRSSAFASFLYNNTYNTECPIDWFGEGRDLREEEYFSYSYIMEYLEDKYPVMYQHLDEMFNSFDLMERIRRADDEFYEEYFPTLTPEVYKQMYQGICWNASGEMERLLKGKWKEFVEWCRKED